MTDARDDTRVLCRTPTPGRHPVRIPARKYAAIADAILAVVPAEGEGFPFADLAGSVAARLDSALGAELGSVSWHTTTVKLDLEARGVLKRATGSGPQRLLRVADKALAEPRSAG